MTRKRKQSNGPRLAIAALGLIAIALGAFLWRIYPEYQRLRQAEGRPPAPLSTPKAALEAKNSSHSVTAELYFAQLLEGEPRMVAIKRELPPGLGVARASLEELISGAVPAGCDRPLPPGTRLKNISVKNNLAIADFSEHLRTAFRGGSDNEGVVVYAIVNTLTSLPGIDKVQILLEGKSISTIGGHLDVSEPLSFDGELVVDDK